jgi:hypothetical protein
VTAAVTWQSIVIGPGFFGIGGQPPFFTDSIALSMDEGRVYPAGSSTTLSWLSRPQYPGPVGTPQGASFCQPTPVLRTPGTLQVWLNPFQDGPDRFGCTSPSPSTMVLERDGVEIGRAIEPFAEFPVPPEPATYRVAYEQRGQSPYLHHSTTAWTFRSAAPSGPTVSQERIPLLVVDYGLPLDDLNRPTGRVATFTVHQVTGTTSRPVTSFQVDTSTDGGTTWRSATVQPLGGGRYRATLPRASAGTQISLRVDATDQDGNRIEQTLFDAYTA